MLCETPSHTRDPAVQAAVSAALSGLGARDVVSTRDVLLRARSILAASDVTDDQIVEQIVSAATGRTMPVVFDHR